MSDHLNGAKFSIVTKSAIGQVVLKNQERIQAPQLPAQVEERVSSYLTGIQKFPYKTP